MKTQFTALFFLWMASVCISAQTQSAHDFIQQFRYQEAIKWLENQPETIENQLQKASCYEKLYNFVDALSVYEQLLRSNPNDMELIIATAECASQAGNAEQSAKYWVRADSISPANLFLQTKKTIAHYRANNWTETIKSAKKVFETDSVPMLLRITGDAFQNLNDPIRANHYYTKALEKNPSDHLSLSRICELFYAMKETGYDTVAIMTEKYLNEINPNQKTIGQLNGMANYSMGEFDKAIAQLQKNVALGDSSYTTTYFLGMSKYAKNWHYRAVKWLDMAYKRNQNDVNLLYYYGTALGRIGDTEKAVMVLQQGIDKIEKMKEMLPDFEFSMADAYLQSGNHTKAVEYYLSIYKRNPKQYKLLYSVANAYDTAKDYKKAVAAYERFLKTAPKGFDASRITHIEGEKKSMTDFYYIVSFKRIKELQEKLFMEKGKSPLPKGNH